MNVRIKKIKVEIWSDILCPFCYIGKRKFEMALSQFPDKNEVEIEWKSFQLSPNMKSDPTKSIHQFLADHKNVSLAEAKNMNDRMTEIASKVGLQYNFDICKVANSFEAHRFLHFAKEKGLQNEAKEMLLAAYFTKGVNIGELETFIQIGEELQLDVNEIKGIFESDKYAQNVKTDIEEASQIGVRGVPFFVFDRKYAVSGAQEPATFLDVLQKSIEEKVTI